LDIKHKRREAVLSVFAAGCLIGIAVSPALAQDVAKSPEKWRPKDGYYVFAGENFAEQCELLPDFHVELRKNRIIGNESFNCKVIRLTDVAEGAIRLDLSCLESDLDEDDDPAHARMHKEIMTLRKIDRKSLFMNITKNGKFNLPESRINYCRNPLRKVR
jgi:hypothetical protein